MRAVCTDCIGGRLCPRHRAEAEARNQAYLARAQELVTQARAAGMKWEEPPIKHSRPRVVEQLAPALEVLKANPGRWAILKEYEHSGGSAAARNLKSALQPAAHWRFTVRSIDGRDKGNGTRLYGCYIGPGGKGEA